MVALLGGKNKDTREEMSQTNLLTKISNITYTSEDRPTQRACVAQGLFFVGSTQGRCPHAPGLCKNAYGPVDIPLIRGVSGAGR